MLHPLTFATIDMPSSSSKLLDNVIDLINKAKLEAKEQKIYLLIQVRHLSDVAEMVCS